MRVLPIGRVQEIFACLDDRCSVRETARRTHAAQRTVARYAHAWRRSRIRGGEVLEEGETLAVRPSRTALDQLAAEAARRDVSRSDLVAELLEAIVESNLIGSILGIASP
jgi:hypothetical protein